MKTDKPKLTERQWEVLERMERGERLTTYIGWDLDGRRANARACQRLAYLGLVSESAAPVGTLRRPWKLSKSGRAALAARRLEREGSGNANRV